MRTLIALAVFLVCFEASAATTVTSGTQIIRQFTPVVTSLEPGHTSTVSHNKSWYMVEGRNVTVFYDFYFTRDDLSTCPDFSVSYPVRPNNWYLFPDHGFPNLYGQIGAVEPPEFFNFYFNRYYSLEYYIDGQYQDGGFWLHPDNAECRVGLNPRVKHVVRYVK